MSYFVICVVNVYIVLIVICAVLFLHNLFIFRFDVGNILMQEQYSLPDRCTAKLLTADLSKMAANLVICLIFINQCNSHHLI